jgi:Na+/melibiose symporter-like transporter
VAVLVRTFISLYEAPSAALAPELATDYAERTSILGYRIFFAWFGGLFVYFLAFTVFLRPDAAHPVGQLNPAGYLRYGVFAGGLMTLTILVSALGTHGRIKTLTTPPRRRLSLKGHVREAVETLSHPSFRVLLLSNLFSSAATGVAFSMTLYFYTFFWRLSAAQISIFAVISLVSALLGTVLAHALRGQDKRGATLVMFLGGLLITTTPLPLRLLGLFPANGDPALFPILALFSLIGLAAMIAASILVYSMTADVVEDSQKDTGRRSEGLFFAANSFVLKAVSGLGVFLSSAILAIVRFPVHAAAGAVDPGVIRNLALVYLPIVFGLYLLAAVCLMGYKITRKTHERNLKDLAEAAQDGPMLPLV